MNRFLTKVYNTTGLSIVGALSASYAVLNIPLLTSIMMPLAGAGMLMTLGGFIPLCFTQPTFHVETEQLNAKEKI